MNKNLFKLYSVILNIMSAITCIAMLLYPLFIWVRGTSDVNLLDTCILSGLGVIIYIITSIALCYPKIWNFPYEITKENKYNLYEDAQEMLVLMRAETMLFFGYMVNCSLYGRTGGKIALILIIMIIYTFFHYMHKMKQHSKFQ